MIKRLFLLCTALLLSNHLNAAVNVVATLPVFGALAQEVGGERITVTSLARGNQDPHFLDAKPSYVVALNRADLLIHGGLDLEGLVSPYASCVLLRPAGASALHVRGRSLPDLVLRGARTRVFLEELAVGELVHEPDAEWKLDVPIPPELEGRELLNLRFESDDYVYRGPDLRHCVVFRLERAALE